MTYPGGKNGSGTWQRIISHIPAHRVLVELFGGNAAITRTILPAERNVVVEVSPGVIDRFGGRIRQQCPHVEIVCQDAFDFLATAPIDGTWCIYADPPYHPDTLKSRPRYEHVLSKADHVRLLRRLAELPCPVLVSGYRCKPYDTILSHWYRLDYIVGTRGGPAMESLWSNHGGPPTWPHDPRFVGRDFRDRETRARRLRTFRRRLASSDPAGLLAMFDELAGHIATRGDGVLPDILRRIHSRHNRRCEQLERRNTAEEL